MTKANTFTSNLVWNWRNAVFGLVIAVVPFLIIASGEVERGLHLIVGALPAAAIGLAPDRKSRIRTIVVGFLFGVFIMLGSFLAQWPVLAVAGIFVISLLSALLASKKPVGMLVLTLCLPLIGVGFSYRGLENSVGLGLTMMAGSLIAYLWSLLFPEYKDSENSQAQTISEQEAKPYGIKVGLAASTAAAIGFASNAQHVGWITGAALFVIRPSKEMQELRSVGRVVSVAVGAFAASWALSQNLSTLVIACLALGAIVCLSATRGSRWYITPAFTTFIVFWSMLYGQATTANIEFRFNERVLETILGVAIAYLFGLFLPNLISKHKQPTD